MSIFWKTITIRKLSQKRNIDGFEEEQTVRFRPPVVLQLGIDDGYLTADNDELGIHLVAEDRKSLVKEAEEELRFLLEEYAEGDEMMMTDGARRLRNELLRRIAR